MSEASTTDANVKSAESKNLSEAIATTSTTPTVTGNKRKSQELQSQNSNDKKTTKVYL